VLGEHNHELLVDDVGVTEAEYDAYEEAGVIGRRPKGV